MRTNPILLATPLLIAFFLPGNGPDSIIAQSGTTSNAKSQIRGEELSRSIIPYEGSLSLGLTYRATMRGDRLFGLSLVPPLRMAAHQAVLVEWLDLSDFPALKRLRRNSRKRQIVFTVVSDEIKRMTEWRWNRTVGCKILRVE